MRLFGYIFVYAFFAFSFYSCASDDSSDAIEVTAPERPTIFGAFEANENNNNIIFEGIITNSSADDLSMLILEYPESEMILMGDVVEATSSEAAFAAARIVRANQLDIHVTDNSTVAREGVDFMLGALNRTKGENTNFGVGAWINEQGLQATDFPFGHEVHLPWINFYQEMGYTFQLATDFYNFSIFAATAEETFFLNEDQINTFNIIN